MWPYLAKFLNSLAFYEISFGIGQTIGRPNDVGPTDLVPPSLPPIFDFCLILSPTLSRLVSTERHNSRSASRTSWRRCEKTKVKEFTILNKFVLKIGTFTDSFFFTTVDRKPKIDNDWIGTADLWYR